MTQGTASQPRAAASKVAKWLADKGKTEDAVALLSAWAASGPNDGEGQRLLAGALRINPASPMAQAAFARMEGLHGDSAELDAAIAKWSEAELTRLEREMAQPSFNRAQVGFNNNVKYKDRVYHIQTEDSGLNKPHIITHLFADGGRVIKSHKRVYGDELGRPDVALYVRGIMKGQQMEMIIALRDGKFDPVIDGKAIGGMELLTELPNVDIKAIKKKKEDAREGAAAAAAAAASAPASAPADLRTTQQSATSPTSAAPPATPSVTMAAAKPRAVPPPVPTRPSSAGMPAPPSVGTPSRPLPPSLPHSPVPLVRPAEAHAVPLVRPPKLRFRLHVLRSLTGGPDVYEPAGDEIILGANGGVPMTGEVFCHPSEAVFRYRSGTLVIEDIEGGNGVFLRVRRPVELEPGDEFIVGDQLLRVEKNPIADDEPDPDPTYFYSSPKWASSFRIVQIFQGGGLGASVVARGTTLQVGSAVGDLVFPSDPLVSEQHCYIEEQAGSIVITDLQSRTGVFVRVKGEETLEHGDQLIVGRTRLAVDLTPSGGGG
ncbi:MAG TPA: FHA domain-containing protein [Polyangiaceae bacterium]